MKITNSIRREIMLTAWTLKRDEPSRPFGDCLRGAWKLSKAMWKHAAKLRLRMAKGMTHLRLSPSLGRSAIERATATQAYGRVADHKAAYTTSKFGY